MRTSELWPESGLAAGAIGGSNQPCRLVLLLSLRPCPVCSPHVHACPPTLRGDDVWQGVCAAGRSSEARAKRRLRVAAPIEASASCVFLCYCRLLKEIEEQGVVQYNSHKVQFGKYLLQAAREFAR